MKSIAVLLDGDGSARAALENEILLLDDPAAPSVAVATVPPALLTGDEVCTATPGTIAVKAAPVGVMRVQPKAPMVAA